VFILPPICYVLNVFGHIDNKQNIELIEKDLSFLRGALPFPEEGKTGPGKAHPLILGVARQQRH